MDRMLQNIGLTRMHRSFEHCHGNQPPNKYLNASVFYIHEYVIIMYKSQIAHEIRNNPTTLFIFNINYY